MAWIAKAANQPMVLETVDLGPLGAEDVEVAVEHCGLCHSDLSVLNNDWGFSQYPAILGHDVVGRVTAVGSNAKGRQVGQRVGVDWSSRPVVGKPFGLRPEAVLSGGAATPGTGRAAAAGHVIELLAHVLVGEREVPAHGRGAGRPQRRE